MEVGVLRPGESVGFVGVVIGVVVGVVVGVVIGVVVAMVVVSSGRDSVVVTRVVGTCVVASVTRK